jgi:hypothetical protein
MNVSYTAMAKGLLSLLISGVAGIGLGKGLALLLRAAEIDRDAASIAGFAIGFLTFLTLLVYLPLWLAPEEFTEPRPSGVEGKLQTAELRMAMAFALVGGLSAFGMTASLTTAISCALCFVGIGAWLGVGLKRRVQRLRVRSRDDTSP